MSALSRVSSFCCHILERSKRPPPRNQNIIPQGSDQIRQAFSKRKKGLVLKSYQLFRLTDARVFLFIANDKGSSWAYATPGFGAPLAPPLLARLRELAGVGALPGPPQNKCHTEVRRAAVSPCCLCL